MPDRTLFPPPGRIIFYPRAVLLLPLRRWNPAPVSPTGHAGRGRARREHRPRTAVPSPLLRAEVLPMSRSASLIRWRRLFGTSRRPAGRKARRAAPPRRLPQLEVLEDRVVPSVLPPSAVDDWTDTDGSTPVMVQVLANDSPPPGGHLLPGSVAVVSPPAHGTATPNPDGSITYTAGATFAGTDTFRYTVGDDLGGTSAPATVSVRVNRPVAADDWDDTDGTSPVTIDVLENDSDPDGHDRIEPALGTGAFVTLVSGPSHGTATPHADASFTYPASPAFTATDTFRYTVTDSHGGPSNVATVFVRVNAPTAVDDLEAFSGTAPVTIDVLENDSDPDGHGHIEPALGAGASVSLVSLPAHGTATPNPDGSITYTAGAGFTGTDTFRYTVTDDNGATSNVATVTVVGSAAGAVNDDFTDTDGISPVAVAVLANDSAAPGDSLVAGSVTVV